MYLILILIIFYILMFNCFKLINTIVDKSIVDTYKKNKKLDTEEFNEIVETVKEKMQIDKNIFIVFKPKAIQENTAVKIINNDVYITFTKNFNKNLFKGVVAHELAHVALNHQDISLKESSKRFRPTMIVITVCCLLVYLVGLLNIKNELKEIIYSAILLISTIYTSIPILFRGKDRQMEYDADLLACKVVGKEDVLKFLYEIEKKNIVARIIHRTDFMSHPSYVKRIEAINRTIL